MEAIVAIGLSSNILQFIEVTKKLVSSAEQILKHGGSLEYLELEKTAQRLRDVAERITFRQLELDRGIDASLIGLCRDCISITDELLPILDSLKVGVDGGKWRSAQQALKARWKKEEVDALERRLDRIGKTLTTHSIMSQQDAIARKLYDLEDRSHRDNAQRTNEMESLKVQLRETFELLREDLRKGEQQQTLMQRLGNTTGRHTGGRGPTPPPDLSELGSITSKEAQYAAEQIVLQQFRFPGIDDRYHGVHAAHDKTFSWVFAPTSTSEASCKASSNFAPFRDWFASDDRFFWITGKPGSGKSTLMKYLCSHEQTRQRLAEWAGNNPLITANFFFWSASKDHLPKSQEGLLRSLLYQIFRLSPETISSIYPEILRLQQQAQPSEEGRRIFNHISHAVPSTVPGLLTMLRQVCSSTTLVQTRLCFFIDGLDEYEGRPTDIIDLIDIFRTLPNLKLCVSSRPWNEFEQAFGKNQSRTLYMHHINRDDIREYVHGTFSQDQNYSAMEATGMKGDDLIEEIIDCSQGVFLWVYLVVRSFREGLVNGDSIRDLQRRLRTLPVDLNEYFDKILLSDVDTVYRQESSRMFNAAVSAKGQLPFMAYWFIGPGNQEAGFDHKLERMCKDQSNARTSQLQKRINARCKGLLEIKMRGSGNEQGLLDPEVDFLHRTVKDFLVAPETQQTLASWDQGSYNMDSMICHAILAQLKTATPICGDFQIATFGSVKRFLNLFFSHCKALNDDPHHDYESLDRILSEFYTTLSTFQIAGSRDISRWLDMFTMMPCNADGTYGAIMSKRELFTLLCAFFELDQYITRYVIQGNNVRAELCSAILYQAVRRGNTAMVQILLEGGTNPNSSLPACTHKQTIWQELVRLTMDEWQTMTRPTNSRIKELEWCVILFLQHGADPNAIVTPHPEVIERNYGRGRRETVENGCCYGWLRICLSVDSMAAIEHYFQRTLHKVEDKEEPCASKKASKWRRGLTKLGLGSTNR